jgi:hypothetical protein
MKKLLFSAIAMSMVLFTACEKDDENTNVFQVVADNFHGEIPDGDNITLSASQTYVLSGTLIVKSGAVLNIPAGTVIKCAKGYSQYILVERGGKIVAEGTAAKPVKFTSNEAAPAAGDWGGIIINGYAPISGATAGTESACEMDNNFKYGGTNAADNSGVLKYVIIEYAGARSSSDIEHNGLTLDAVGNGTVIENILVKNSADDAIEFFGGSVNVTNLLALSPDDDMFDCTQGWIGKLKNAYGVWESGYASGESDPRGVEADGNLDGNGADHVNQSDFTMENITIANNSTYTMMDALKIRRGAKASITNCVVKNGTVTDLVDLSDSKGAGNAASAISVTKSNLTVSGKEVNGTGNVSVNPATANIGADKSLFTWTGVTL